MSWIVSRIGALAQTLWAPERAFAHDMRGPSFLVPLLLLGALFSLISFAQSPYQIHWSRHQMEAAGLPADQVSAGVELMRRSNRWVPIVVPLLLLLRWLIQALLLWLAAQFVLGLLRFYQALTIVAFSYLPVLFRDAVACLVIYLRSPQQIELREGLYVALGLDLLFPSMPRPWSTLAGSVNLFEAWFVLLLATGVAGITHSRARTALAIVIPAWLLVALLQLGLAALGQRIAGI